MFGYRITSSMVALFRHDSHELIRPLASGLILIPTTSDVNSDGTIEATCGEHRVRVFQRDLMEKAERIELEPGGVLSDQSFALGQSRGAATGSL